MTEKVALTTGGGRGMGAAIAIETNLPLAVRGKNTTVVVARLDRIET